MLNQTLEKQKEVVVLEQALAKKSKIKFRVNNSNMWYATYVVDIKGDEITLAFPEMFVATDVILGDTLFCSFSSGQSEYSFEGEIDSIRIYFPQQIKLKAVGEVKNIENVRQSKRSDAIFLANVFAQGGSEVIHSCVRDVSNTGLRIITKNHISEGEEMEIHIALPLRNIFDSVVKLKGKVMWSKVMYNRNEYGIAITEMEEVYRNRMKYFLDTYGK